TYLGEVARATMELWGVPLRPADVAELDYRQRYIEHDVPLIEEWGVAHMVGTFAGVYVDQRAGGLMRIGFTTNQAASLANLTQNLALTAPIRTTTFPGEPSHSVTSLEALLSEVENAAAELPGGLIYSVTLDVEHNNFTVRTSNVDDATASLDGRFGSTAPL